MGLTGPCVGHQWPSWAPSRANAAVLPGTRLGVAGGHVCLGHMRGWADVVPGFAGRGWGSPGESLQEEWPLWSGGLEPRVLGAQVGPATLPALLQGRPEPGCRVQGCPTTRVSLCCRVFEMCHAVIPPGPFYQGCVFDQCHMTTSSDVVCSSLELYASLCASHGVCIDWRGQTNHTCRECPPGVGFLGEKADPKAERAWFLER